MTPEHEKAKAWRESLNLSKQELADRAGYSESTVYWMEKGQGAPRRVDGEQQPTPLNAWAWARYKATCAGIDAEIRTKKKFNWGESR